jgi:hypothetical protein
MSEEKQPWSPRRGLIGMAVRKIAIASWAVVEEALVRQ